jgi:hypothetical protein
VTELVRAIVVFGDVVDSRRDPGASEYLRDLRDELDRAYAAGRLAPAGFTQGDELQLLLQPGADPFAAVLRAGLHPEAREVRWAIVAGEVEPGSGPATERTGPAFLDAREAVERARTRREGAIVQTGDARTDALLADLAPLLPTLLGELTARQREVARLVLVEGLRLADVADRLRVSRATVSVIADRGHVRHIGRLASSLWTLFRDGASRNGLGEANPGAGRSPAVAGAGSAA